MPKRGELTYRQKRFVEAYLETGAATKAAERAGFAPGYAQGAMRQPAVKAALAERRKEMSCDAGEIWNFLTDVMHGKITATDLQTTAAFELGRRAGLWHSAADMKKLILGEDHESAM